MQSSTSKTYDGTTNLLDMVIALEELELNDEVVVNANGVYEAKDVGTTDYTISGFILSGKDAENYFIAAGAAAQISGTDGEITKRTLTVTPDLNQRKDLEQADPELTYTFTGAVSGEVPRFSGSLARVSGETEGVYPIEIGTLAIVDNVLFFKDNYNLDVIAGVNFIIGKKAIDGSQISIDLIPDQTYSGRAMEPSVIIKDNTMVLEEDKDYSLSYADHTNVGTATITVNGIGNYRESTTTTFTITAKTLTVSGLTGEDKEYDGTTIATTSGLATLEGVFDTDEVELIGEPVYSFETAATGEAIKITTTGFDITGKDAGNYSLLQPILSADIKGITQRKEEFNVKLYPNPAQELLRIESENAETGKVTIYTNSGNKVLEGYGTKLYVTKLPSGTYLARIESSEGALLKVIKFIKK